MLYFIHLQFGTKHERSCLKHLKNIASTIGTDYTIVLVDNSTRREVALDKRVIKIPGSNQFREFSGWESGLRYIRDREGHCGPVIFSNDTFARHRAFDGPMFKAFSAGIKKHLYCQEPIFFGDVDLIDALPPYIVGSDNRRYISTYLFFLNGNAFERLDTFLPPEPLRRIVAVSREDAHSNSVVQRDVALTPYLRMIEEWLYRPSIKRNRWYGFETLTDSNFSKFTLKFQSILLEHFLSQKLSAKGVLLIDWLENINRSPPERVSFVLMHYAYALSWRMRRFLGIGH